MNTETLPVLIVAKTRRARGACIGALAPDGRSLRLEAANAASDEHAGSEYAVGDVHPQIVPPHVETVVVYAKSRLRRAADPIGAIERLMPPIQGPVEALYDGLLRRTDTGMLYLAGHGELPSRSTLFWRPDRPLRLVTDGVRLHYCYDCHPDAGDASAGDTGERRLAFVGFQEPLDVIPAGTLVRVSLAHWWHPRDHPEHELRCYGQLSGWFLPPDMPHGDRRSPGVRIGGGEPSLVHSLPLSTPGEQRLHRTLRDVFGYDSFRPLQEEIVTALLAGRDTLAVMPTGAGKSLCYQLPALLWERLTVVVSPLIALMQDQVDALRALGAPAAYLNSTLTYAEQRRLMEQVRGGEIKLLYVAPETLVRPELLHLLDETGVDCLAVDEAHCISSWGHDFRPEYRQLEPVRRRFGNAVCLAMTATAAPRVRADIKQSLGIGDAGEIVASFDRPNLFLAAQPRGNGKRDLLAFLARRRSDSGIIYCMARRTVDDLAAYLAAQGYAALPYHAGLDDQTRRRNQRAFVRDETPIIVATVAFGMGINKPNVRFVVHYNLPASIEQYYQEIGRAGRDGLRADCLLLYHAQDVVLQAQMIDDGAEEERAGRNARLGAMHRFAQARSCRRPPLLHYFGEERTEERCDFCDNCTAEASEQPQTDVTAAAQKFLACVQRTRQMFGAGHIIDVLRGSRSQRVLDRRHDALPMYAQGKEYSAAEWRTLVQQWLQQGVLDQDMEHGSLRLTERSRAVLSGEQKVFAELGAPEQVESAGGMAGARQGAELPAYDAGLFEHLRGLRRELAAAANLPPYIIFSDRALIEMAAYLPRSPMEFATINGVGRAKLETYGRQFMAEIATYAEAQGLQPQPRPAGRSVAPAPALRPRQGGRRADEVGDLYAQGRSLAELQSLYNVKRSTIVNHLRDYQQGDGAVDAARLRSECGLPPEAQERVFSAFAELGSERLAPVYEALAGGVDYEDLHLLRLVWQVQATSPGPLTES
jgi:ATP-dependent DNA helicase RecQ